MTMEELNFEIEATGIVTKLRGTSRLTQKEFADRIGMSQSQLARIESGKQFPKIETLAKIASGAGYSLQIHFLPSANAKISPISIIFEDTTMTNSSEYSLYFASIQQGLLSERENFLWVLHDVRSSLRLRNIHPEVIPNYLGLAKICHDQCLGKSWTLIDIIEESSRNGIAINNPTVFTSLFDILKDERRKYRAFFTDTQGLASVLQEQHDVGSSESKILRVIGNHLEIIDKETEDRLLDYVEDHSDIRFAAIKLIIPDHFVRELNNYDDKQFKLYQQVLGDVRKKRKEALDQLDQLDRLLAYRKREIRMSKRLLDNYADRLMRQQQSEFIGKSTMESTMSNITNLDEVRQQAIAQLEALQKYLGEKGKAKEAEDIAKEVTKLRENTYQIAFVATFSAGKSTLINAMLGRDILPSMAKPTTGRLTFVNDCATEISAQVEIAKTGDQRVIVLSYKDPQDLQKYLNRYLRNGWIETAEVFSEESSLQFDSPVDFVQSAFHDPNEANDIHAHQAKLTLTSGIYSLGLTDLSQVELSSFINNDAVKDIKINAPVKHLTERVPLEGIQFVDTPGTNSARHVYHKRITFDFISKANAVVYVMNFTNAFTEDDALLLKEIRKQQEYNPNFCNKLFFAINKIDQDNSHSQSLNDSIASIHKDLNDNYDFNLPRDRVIGIAALPALLYRMKQANLLQSHQRRELNSYVVRLLDNDDFWDATPEELDVAEKKVLTMSNIEELESSIIQYLSRNNKTQEIILDALSKSLVFSQSCEREIQQELAVFHLPLKKLQQVTEQISISVQDAIAEKNSINERLISDQKNMKESIINLYQRFDKNVKELISNAFDKISINQPVDGLTSEQLKKLQRSVDRIIESGRTPNREQLENILGEYQDVINEVVKSMYVAFESELKEVCNQEKSKIITGLNYIADHIISKLEQDLNQNLGIVEKLLPLEYIASMPKLSLPSIRDIVDQKIYQSEQKKTEKKKDTFSDKEIFKTFFFVNPSLVRENTEKAIDLSLSNGQKKAIAISRSEISKAYKKTIENVNNAIVATEQYLNEKIEERKQKGDDVMPKLEQLEMELDSLTQNFTALNHLYSFVESL